MILIPVPAWPSSPAMGVAVFQCGHCRIVDEDWNRTKRLPMSGPCHSCRGLWRQLAQFIWLPPRDTQGKLYG